jgi:hypothetical protein
MKETVDEQLLEHSAHKDIGQVLAIESGYRAP